MHNKVQNVEECDATKFNSSNADWLIKNSSLILKE